jgi:soluble calcium-activated nucleotidase 1
LTRAQSTPDFSQEPNSARFLPSGQNPWLSLYRQILARAKRRMRSNGSSVSPAPRSESMAYPKASTSTLVSKMQYVCRQNGRALIATLVFFAFVGVLASDALHDLRQGTAGGLRGIITPKGINHAASLQHWGGAVHNGYFKVQDSVMGPMRFNFAAVTDLDELSRVESEKKPTFRSVLVPGTLTATQGRYHIKFENARELLTLHNEAGRGAEFSELTVYNDRLLTFDDRTGDVFELLNNAEATKSFVVPRFVITEGNGDTDKGMKWEWSTVKNGELYMGSMGKEYTRPDGTIQNRNNLWIGILNAEGELRREDWTDQYNVVRKALKALSPGYLIIEAVNWSDHLQKWVFLPRRISETAYDENEDERRGGRQLVLVSPDFSSTQVVDINLQKDPLKGFSTFAFVPNTNDRHAFAIRSVEEDCVGGLETCKQRSYFIVFDVLSGETLSEEVKYPEDLKFEGLEFVNIYTKPPPFSNMT